MHYIMYVCREIFLLFCSLIEGNPIIFIKKEIEQEKKKEEEEEKTDYPSMPCKINTLIFNLYSLPPSLSLSLPPLSPSLHDSYCRVALVIR